MASYPKLATDDAAGEHYEDQDEKGNAYVPTCSLKQILSILFFACTIATAIAWCAASGFR